MNEKTVLAVDPGSSKCGLALVTRRADGKVELLWRRVSPMDELYQNLDDANHVRPFSMIIVGSGTKSRDTVTKLRDHMLSIGILVVDEKDTTVQARERYWEYHPRRGWRKFLPSTLQVPPDPVDDFVALILAERVLAQ